MPDPDPTEFSKAAIHRAMIEAGKQRELMLWAGERMRAMIETMRQTVRDNTASGTPVKPVVLEYIRATEAWVDGVEQGIDEDILAGLDSEMYKAFEELKAAYELPTNDDELPA